MRRQVALALQTTGSAPAQRPARQRSRRVHRLASSHTELSGTAGFVQRPVRTLQTPARWQSSLGVHTIGSPPLQTPSVQVSARVQASLSSQVVPSAAGGAEQVPVARSQTPAS